MLSSCPHNWLVFYVLYNVLTLNATKLLLSISLCVTIFGGNSELLQKFQVKKPHFQTF